jgi:hypothetical protein
MCFDPVSMAVMAVTVGGAGLSAYGQMKAGEGEAANTEHNAQVTEHNARLTNMETSANVSAMDSDARSLAASQRAAAAASGRNPDVGSPLALQMETERSRRLNAMTALWNAETATDSAEHSAAGLRMQGKNAKTASKYAAAGTFLSGLGSGAASLKPRAKA